MNKLLIIILATLPGILFSLFFAEPFGSDIYFHYQISKNLVENNFLPMELTNFGENIPFGYPPLIHYFTAILSKLIPLIFIYKVLPWILVSVLIASLYLLYREYEPSFAITATAIYFAIPLYLHSIFAGEIARLPGLIFLTLTLWMLKRYKNTFKNEVLIFAGVFYGLTILSHLYAAALLTILIFYLVIEQYHIHRKVNILLTILIGLLIASPWLVYVTMYYGPLYFIKVSTIHSSGILSYIPYLLLTLIGIITIMGIWKKRFYSIFLILIILSDIMREFLLIPLAFYIAKYLNKYNKFPFYTLIIIGLINTMIILANPQMKPVLNQDLNDAITWFNRNAPSEATSIAIKSNLYYSKNIKELLFQKLIGHFNKKIDGWDTALIAKTNHKFYTWFGFEWANEPKRLEIMGRFWEKICAKEFLEVAHKNKVYPNYLWIRYPNSANQNYCNDFNEPNFIKVYQNSEVVIYSINY